MLCVYSTCRAYLIYLRGPLLHIPYSVYSCRSLNYGSSLLSEKKRVDKTNFLKCDIIRRGVKAPFPLLLAKGESSEPIGYTPLHLGYASPLHLGYTSPLHVGSSRPPAASSRIPKWNTWRFVSSTLNEGRQQNSISDPTSITAPGEKKPIRF